MISYPIPFSSGFELRGERERVRGRRERVIELRGEGRER